MPIGREETGVVDLSVSPIPEIRSVNPPFREGFRIEKKDLTKKFLELYFA